MDHFQISLILCTKICEFAYFEVSNFIYSVFLSHSFARGKS